MGGEWRRSSTSRKRTLCARAMAENCSSTLYPTNSTPRPSSNWGRTGCASGLPFRCEIIEPAEAMMASTARAAGRRVLVVEDEYLLANRMVREFAKLGVETVGPAGTIERALDLIEHGEPSRWRGARHQGARRHGLRGGRRAPGARRAFRFHDRVRPACNTLTDTGTWHAARSLSIPPRLCAPCFQMRAKSHRPAADAYRLSSGAFVGIMSSNKGLSHGPHTRRSVA